jgi:hypothetical protein
VRLSNLLKSNSKSKLCYDWRSAGQSVLEQSTHLGLTTRSWLLSDSCELVDLGRPLWREHGSAVCNCYWPSPAQSFSGPSPVGLVAIFYCLRFETSFFVASYDSQGHGGGIRLRLHTGFCLFGIPLFISLSTVFICRSSWFLWMFMYQGAFRMFLKMDIQVPCASREEEILPSPGRGRLWPFCTANSVTNTDCCTWLVMQQQHTRSGISHLLLFARLLAATGHPDKGFPGFPPSSRKC